MNLISRVIRTIDILLIVRDSSLKSQNDESHMYFRYSRNGQIAGAVVGNRSRSSADDQGLGVSGADFSLSAGIATEEASGERPEPRKAPKEREAAREARQASKEDRMGPGGLDPVEVSSIFGSISNAAFLARSSSGEQVGLSYLRTSFAKNMIKL